MKQESRARRVEAETVENDSGANNEGSRASMICLDGFYGIFRSSAAHPRNENGVAAVCEKNSLILGLVSVAKLAPKGRLRKAQGASPGNTTPSCEALKGRSSWCRCLRG